MHSLSAVVLMVTAAIGLWILTGFWSGKDRDTAIPPPEPLADLQLSPEQQQSLRHAEDVLVRRCMRDRGMDFHVAGTAEAPASLPNPYGLLDSAEVAERGYGLHGAAPVPSDPRLTDRERDALFGTEASQKTIPLAEGGELVVHTDGCFYQAQTELYGEDWKRLLHGEETLAAKIVARVNRDPRVNATQHTWVRCMRRAGYSVTTLEDVRPDAMRRMEREASDRADGEAEFNALLDQAARDVACQKRARVEPAIRAAQKAVERSVVRGHQHDLGELKTLRAEALATARRLGGATE
ncbi:hypothetical protein ACFRNT_47475 [Streptomyces sp. NPDC056697]|uniref:hypothetical protein n=1 Tax=Streptomyces sp. NPDC056697 TaxID=3345915 RepID=UPI0036A15488